MSAKPESNRPSFVAFIGHRKFAEGEKGAIASAIHGHLQQEDSRAVLVFDLESGQQIFVDTNGNEAQVRARYGSSLETKPNDSTAPEPRERRRTSAVGKEVTLLPRHWAWLESQPNGSSATLRRLVDRARKNPEPEDQARLSQTRTHRFISSMAGDLPGFEEAIRALFAADETAFNLQITNWPKDLVAVTTELSQGAFFARTTHPEPRT